METPISASDLVPNYYETARGHDEDDAHSELADEDTHDLVDDLTYDIYNLVACDYHSLSLESHSNTNTKNINEIIHENATRATQLLINRYAYTCCPPPPSLSSS